jgi:hypothetical protein
MDVMFRIFNTPVGAIVGKIHPLHLHIHRRNVELLSLPTRPTGTSDNPNR